jgi:hypothetical protein
LHSTGFQSDWEMGLTNDVGRILEGLFVPPIIVSVNKIDQVKLIEFAPKTKESKRKICHTRRS